MKTKIIGAYAFTSKAGKNLVNLSVTDDRLNSVGVCSVNLMATADSLPDKVENMINNEYLIDVRYGQNGSMFAQNFYKVSK